MKRKLVYLTATMLLAFSGMGLAACDNQNGNSGNQQNQQNLHSVLLSESVLKLDIDEQATLILTVDGSTSMEGLHPVWRSSNKEIVTVSKGVVTAIADGEVDITVIVRNDALKTLGEATCHVVVGGLKIHLSKQDTTLYLAGGTKTEELTILESVENVVWESSNTDVVTVSDGIITAVSAGEAVITAISGELSGKCNVTVFDELLTLPKLTIVKPNQETTLELVGTIDNTAIWENSNSEVATLQDNKVKGLKDGFTEITLNYKGQIVSTVVAVSSSEDTEKTNITKGKKADAANNPGKWFYLLESSQATTSAVPSIQNNIIDYDILTIGTSGANYAYLRYQPDTEGANVYDLTYYVYSSNGGTIAIDGNDTDLQPGVNVITREFESKNPTAQAPAQIKFRSTGQYYIMPVFTFNRALSVLKVSENNKILYLNGGAKTFTLTAALDGVDTDVEWSSANPAVATVENGVVTALAEGNTKIIASKDGLTATCDVKVEATYIDGKTYLPSNGQKANVCADPGKWFYYLDGGSNTVSEDPYSINDMVYFNLSGVGSSAYSYLRYQPVEEGDYSVSLEINVETLNANTIDITGGTVTTAQTLVMENTTETVSFDFTYKAGSPFQMKFKSAGNYTIKFEFRKG